MIAVLVLGSVLFQQFHLLTVSGYALNLGPVVTVPLLWAITRRYRVVLLISTWLLLIMWTVSAAFLGDARYTDNYLGTLILFLTSSAIIVSALGQLNWDVIKSFGFAHGLWLSLAFLCLLSVLQVALGAVGSDALFNLFGDRQYLHPYDPQLGSVRVPRAQGLFLEPSYNAFVIGALAVSLITLGRRVRSSIIFAVVGLLASQSATGLLLLSIVLLITAFRARFSGAVTAILVASATLWYSGDYLTTRLTSIGTDGTSAYYRLVAPLPILGDILDDHPMGMALGSIEQVISSYGLNMAGVQATSLDNGMYVLIYYFGWLGVLVLMAMAVTSTRVTASCMGRRDSLAWIAPIWLVASLLFSGSVMTPEFAFMTLLVIVTFRAPGLFEGEAEVDKSRRNAPKRSHCDVQRLGRASSDTSVITASQAE